MENNNRLMPHIRRTTHIMKFAHRNSFDFHFFNARGDAANLLI
ncbi:leader peptide SpeFL [Escherichia coli]